LGVAVLAACSQAQGVAPGTSGALLGAGTYAAARPAASPRAVALVPLYSYPSGSQVWAPLVSAHAQAPDIPVDAIVDVTSSGPGKKVDANYVAGVKQLHAGGIAVLGYVDTQYGRRALSKVETDIGHWQSWYGVDGIFLDVMASKSGYESYYLNATTFAKSLNLAPVIGNPGTDTAESYEATVDALVIWESKGYPTLKYLGGGWHAKYPRSHFGFIAYGIATLNTGFDDQAEADVLYEFVTNATGGGRYGHLPPYIDQFLSTL
jgi:hypothetical protein